MSETSPRNAPDAGPSPTGRAASGRAGRLVGAAFLFLLLNSAWLRAFPSANLVYVTGVLLHVAAGLALAAGLWFSSRELFRRVRANRWAMVTLSASRVPRGGSMRRGRHAPVPDCRRRACRLRVRRSPAASVRLARSAHCVLLGRGCAAARLLGRSRSLVPACGAADRQPDRGSALDGLRGRREGEPVLPLGGADRQRRQDPVRFLPGVGCLRGMPQGCLRAVAILDAPVLFVQQPVLPEVDRIHARDRGGGGLQVVRRLPRPRHALQRDVRRAGGRAVGQARGPCRPGLRLLPLSGSRAGHDGQRGVRDRVPPAARSRSQRVRPAAGGAQLRHAHRARRAPARLPEAVHAARTVRSSAPRATRCIWTFP